MFKLLVLLFVIKMYAQNDIFKYILTLLRDIWPAFMRTCLCRVHENILQNERDT